jgi:hypothetical protein
MKLLLIISWIILLIAKYWPIKDKENEKTYRLALLTLSMGMFLSIILLMLLKLAEIPSLM